MKLLTVSHFSLSDLSAVWGSDRPLVPVSGPFPAKNADGSMDLSILTRNGRPWEGRFVMPIAVGSYEKEGPKKSS